MITVALVDDEALIRAGLRVLIDAEPDLRVVGEAGDGSEVLDLVRRQRPDVVLMDVRMPRLDGIEAVRLLNGSLDHPPRVLVVTTFENDDYVYGALRAGASGFLLKRSRPEEILGAVRLVATGDSLLFPAAIRSLARVSPRADTPAARAVASLTERETTTLLHMARGRSNSEIAEELVVSTETVKSHVSSILLKLGARDRTQTGVGLQRGAPRESRSVSMKYLFLACGAPKEWESQTEADAEAEMNAIIQWAEKLVAEGKLEVGVVLEGPETAKTVRVDGDGRPVVTDGPYVELKEIIGGISYLNVDTMDEAVAIASTFPGLRTFPSNSVEVRPVMEP